MTERRRIVCLANSRKLSGRCIAGREVLEDGFGCWIRPISTRAGGELSEEERRYANGAEPKILDIIDVPFRGARPRGYQKENHLIDPEDNWTLDGRVSWPDIQRATEDPAGPLWVNGSSSRNRSNDRVPVADTTEFGRSLYLIRPDQVALEVVSEERTGHPSKRHVLVEFNSCEQSYRIKVTDPWIEQKFLAGNDGRFPLRQALLCVSLADEFKGFAYKLAAAVITPDRAGA